VAKAKQLMCGASVTYTPSPNQAYWRATWHCDRPYRHRGPHSCDKMNWTDPFAYTTNSTLAKEHDA
jgi:hypothetical protein